MVPVVAVEAGGDRRVRKPQEAREANASRFLPVSVVSSAAWPAA